MGLGWVEVKEGVNCDGAAVHDLALGIHSRPVQVQWNGKYRWYGGTCRSKYHD